MDNGKGKIPLGGAYNLICMIFNEHYLKFFKLECMIVSGGNKRSEPFCYVYSFDVENDKKTRMK